MKKSCKDCGEEMPPNKLQCPHCKSWSGSSQSGKDGTQLLSEVVSAEGTRIKTGPWDYCWGGGIVLTSVTLLGAKPGAGKSTLILQLGAEFGLQTEKETLYIASEEALAEIKLRADRLNIKGQKFIRMVPAMGGLADFEEVINTRKPGAIIVDSLQGLVGTDDANSVQALKLLKIVAVKRESPVIVVNHFTKAGDYAGLMTLQHDVDTLLVMEVEGDDGIRELITKKNRNGPAFISICFDMTAKGLVQNGEPKGQLDHQT